MNILIIEDSASSRSGGAERSMRNFCEYIAKNHKVFLVYERPGDYISDPAKNTIYQGTYQVATTTIREQGFLNWSRSLIQLVRIIRREKIDIINTHVNHCLALLRIAKWFTGVQVTVYLKWIATTSRVGKLTAWGLEGADRVATVSQFVAEYWKNNGLRLDRLRVIPEGIQLNVPTTNTHFSHKELHLSFAGRICREKGLHILVDTLGQLHQKGIPAYLHIAGYFETEMEHPQLSYHLEVNEMISSLGLAEFVVFHGYVDPLTTFLNQHDMVVVPSICQDAHPLVILEAFAVKKPVIASRVGGVPEILKDRFDEFIFQSEDANDLASKILDVKKRYLDSTSALEKLSREIDEYARSRYALNISMTALENYLIYAKAS